MTETLNIELKSNQSAKDELVYAKKILKDVIAHIREASRLQYLGRIGGGKKKPRKYASDNFRENITWCTDEATRLLDGLNKTIKDV